MSSTIRAMKEKDRAGVIEMMREFYKTKGYKAMP